ncbi:jg9093 [Pararge aegeria aegeria]|uniref:Jg9093 protein n=1 Tax=Pararge aegeria aegeria TaxID=348720 RepID=A0A8S4RWQ5_9NEOP|nr:jg9093 [Pararge aegeria aegeria]
MSHHLSFEFWHSSIVSDLGHHEGYNCVNVVEQNPETVTGADEFADRIRDGVASLKSRIEEAKNFLSELRAKVVNNNTPAATPVQVVDNSVNGVSVVDNNPAPGNLVDVVDSGFSQPGANLDIVDPGFYISPQPNVRPPRRHNSKNNSKSQGIWDNGVMHAYYIINTKVCEDGCIDVYSLLPIPVFTIVSRRTHGCVEANKQDFSNPN